MWGWSELTHLRKVKFSLRKVRFSLRKVKFSLRKSVRPQQGVGTRPGLPGPQSGRPCQPVCPEEGSGEPHPQPACLLWTSGTISTAPLKSDAEAESAWNRLCPCLGCWEWGSTWLPSLALRFASSALPQIQLEWSPGPCEQLPSLAM